MHPCHVPEAHQRTCGNALRSLDSSVSTSAATQCMFHTLAMGNVLCSILKMDDEPVKLANFHSSFNYPIAVRSKVVAFHLGMFPERVHHSVAAASL